MHWHYALKSTSSFCKPQACIIFFNNTEHHPLLGTLTLSLFLCSPKPTSKTRKNPSSMKQFLKCTPRYPCIVRFQKYLLTPPPPPPPPHDLFFYFWEKGGGGGVFFFFVKKKNPYKRKKFKKNQAKWSVSGGFKKFLKRPPPPPPPYGMS